MRSFTGLRIDIYGSIWTFHYSPFDVSNIDKYAEDKGYGKLEILETFNIEDKTYLICGWKNGEMFNDFDLNESNPFGDIIIYCINVNGMPSDADEGEFRDYYVDDVDNLSDYLLEDELEEKEEEYEYNEFCVRYDSDSEAGIEGSIYI